MRNKIKKVLIHRNPDQFWKVLLKQGFVFSTNKIALTFAREVGGDTGGLFREF